MKHLLGSAWSKWKQWAARESEVVDDRVARAHLSIGERRRNDRVEGEMMGKIDDACQTVVDKVEGAIACGVVDLDTGMLLGIHNRSNYTRELNELVAAATMDLFCGANVGRVEEMVRAHRGIPEDGKRYFQEIHITSENNNHLAKVIKGGKAVVMLVTDKNTNLGLAWVQLKTAVPNIEPFVP